MAPDVLAAQSSAGDRVVRVGLRRFQRLFNMIIGAFGVLFALQTGDSFVADVPSMSNPLGHAVIVLVALSVLAGLGPVVRPNRARTMFLTGIGLYAAALLLWPLAVHRSMPTDPMPWLVAVWPVPVAYAAQVSTSRVVTILGGVLLSGYTGIALRFCAGLDLADAVVNSLFMAGIAVVLVLLLGVVRRGIVVAGEAQQVALAGFAASQIDEATETERKRTDALLNDAVLTTFLSASAAHTAESEDLARRMATNALRVLMHVNGIDRQGAMIAFGQALAEESTRLEPLLAHFDVDLGASESLMLPEAVARAVVAVLAQAMENSVERVKGATRRVLRADPLGPDGVRVRVEDDGHGFDAAAVGQEALGVGQESVQRLRALEGRVDVRSASGDGRSLTISWGSIVMVGTTLLSEDEDPLRLTESAAGS